MNPDTLRDEFEAWLKSKDPLEGVGVPGSPCDCPLATFCNQTHAIPGGVWEVTSDDGCGLHLYLENGHKVIDLDNWAWEFVYKVDGSMHQRIVAGQALEFLNGGSHG